MRTFDPTPLWRSTVGFDRLFDLIDQTTRWTGEDNYPPYNIARTGEDHYHAIQAQCDTSVRRCTEFQRFEKKSEFVARFLLGEAEYFENPGLDVAAMDSDRTPSDLSTIQHQVICFRANPLRMSFERREVFINR